MKKCSKCGLNKPLSEFTLHPRGINGRHPSCKVCRNKYYRVAYKEGRIRKVPYTYAKQLKKYNLTTEDYKNARNRQGGRCLICNRVCKLVVDHNHLTGTFRGLLCTNCNTGIGKFGDSVELLNRAVDYLEKSGGVIPDGLLNR